MSEDRLPELVGELRNLAGRPVVEHPEALEEVHRALVAELDALAAARTRPGGADQSTHRPR